MPSLRRLGHTRLGQAIGGGLSNVGDTIQLILKQRLAEQSQNRQNAAILARQRENAMAIADRQTELEQLQSGNRVSELKMQHPEYSLSPAQRAFGNITSRYNAPTVQKPEDIPPDEAVLGEFMQSGGDASMQDLLKQIVAARRSQLQGASDVNRAEDLSKTPHLQDNVMGVGSGPDFLPTQRTGAAQGAEDLAKFQAGEGSPAYQIAKAQSENEYIKLTSGPKARAAGQTAGAEASARVAAETSPAAIAGYAARAGAESAARVSNAPATEAERKTQATVELLDKSNAKLIDMEKRGLGLPIGGINVGTKPLLRGTVGQMYPDDVMKYLDEALAFGNPYIYETTGKQLNETEPGRLLAPIIVYMSDAPDVKAAKIQRRSQIVAEMRYTAGKAGFQKGESLGRVVKGGALDPSVINYVTDPEVIRGFTSIMGPPLKVGQ